MISSEYTINEYVHDVSRQKLKNIYNVYIMYISHIFKSMDHYNKKSCDGVHSSRLPKVLLHWWTAVAQWLRCCATNWKVAGSIPADVTGFFIDIKSFRSHYGLGVNSASNRNEYQEYFLGVKATGA